jgi:DNA-binding NarL/FixJ family response regulator
MPRVLVVSDILLYREGVARGLQQLGSMCVVGAAGGSEAMTAMREAPADAVLLDASAAESLAFARTLKSIWPDVPVVGFGIGDDASGLACAEAGLVGFVGRDGTLAELASTVDGALAGEVQCSPRLAALLCARVAALSGSRLEGASPLTRRERQIAELVSDGMSNKEIAIELHIGPATVKNHVHNILEKFKVARRGAIGSRVQRRWQSNGNLAPLERGDPKFKWALDHD